MRDKLIGVTLFLMGFVLFGVFLAMPDCHAGTLDSALSRTTLSWEAGIMDTTGKAGTIGYRTLNGWDFQATTIAEAPTTLGYQKQTYALGVSKIFRPAWQVFEGRLFFRLGVSHTPDNELIAQENFRLGVGFIFDAIEVEWMHDSPGETGYPNRGWNRIAARIAFW